MASAADAVEAAPLSSALFAAADRWQTEIKQELTSVDPYEQIRRQTPKGAAFYQLVLRTASGHMTTFPDEGHCWAINQAPPMLAPGSYGILFFEITKKQIPVSGAKVTFGFQHSLAPGRQEVPLFEEEQASAGASPAAPSRAASGSNSVDQRTPTSRPGRKVSSAGRSRGDEDETEDLEDIDDDDEEEDGEDEDGEDEDAGDDEDELEDEDSGEDGGEEEGAGDDAEEPYELGDSEGSRPRLHGLTADEPDRAESARSQRRPVPAGPTRKGFRQSVRMIKLQHAIHKANAELMKRTLVTKEVAEVQTVLGLQRRELVEAQRLLAASHRRESARLELATRRANEQTLENLAALDKGSKQILTMLEHVVSESQKRITLPPPPPTDWGPILQSGIDAVGRVAFQLVANRALPPNSSSGKSRIGGRPSAEGAQGVDQDPRGREESADSKLEILAKKLSQLGDMELARRMAEPESIHDLLREIADFLKDDDESE